MINAQKMFFFKKHIEFILFYDIMLLYRNGVVSINALPTYLGATSLQNLFIKGWRKNYEKEFR